MLAACLHGQTFTAGGEVIQLDGLEEQDLQGLEGLIENPVDLNRTGREELWFVNDSLNQRIITARTNGAFAGWPDLASRAKLSQAELEALQQFTFISSQSEMVGQISNRVIMRNGEDHLRLRVAAKDHLGSLLINLDSDPNNTFVPINFATSFEVRSIVLLLGSHRYTWGTGLLLANEFNPPRGEALLSFRSPHNRLRAAASRRRDNLINGLSLRYGGDRASYTVGRDLSDGDSLAYLSGSIQLSQLTAGFLITTHSKPADITLIDGKGRGYAGYLQYSINSAAGQWMISHENATRQARQAHITWLKYVSAPSLINGTLKLALSIRHFPDRWRALRGRLPNSRSSSGNEHGEYMGWRWSTAGLKFAGYLDRSRPLTPPTVQTRTVTGEEVGLSVERKGRRFTGGLNWRQSRGGWTTEAPGSAAPVEQLFLDTRSNYWRFHGDYVWSAAQSVGVLLAYSRSADPPEGGEALGLRWRYKPSWTDLKVTLGGYRFRVNAWSNRVYVWEDGLPGEFNFRSLSGTGYRIYGRIIKPLQGGALALRIARQWRSSSSNDDSRTSDTEIGLQIDIAL